MLKDLLKSALEYAPKIGLAILTLVVGMWIINAITNVIRGKLDKNNIDKTLTPFLISLFSILAKVMLLLSVASIIGIQTTSFVAVLGAAGFAVGLALQGSLANFAGGVLILVFRPFKPGDYIVAQGIEGTVKEIQILVTSIYTLDNKQIIIPNGVLAGGTIWNYTSMKFRRVDVNFIIGYNNDLEAVRKVLLDIAAQNKLVINEDIAGSEETKAEKPVVLYTLNEFTVGVSFRMYAKPEHYFDVLFQISEAIHAKIGKEIKGPRPARDIFMYQQN
jgi:small conductance mechanosensitive channel